MKCTVCIRVILSFLCEVVNWVKWCVKLQFYIRIGAFWFFMEVLFYCLYSLYFCVFRNCLDQTWSHMNLLRTARFCIQYWLQLHILKWETVPNIFQYVIIMGIMFRRKDPCILWEGGGPDNSSHFHCILFAVGESLVIWTGKFAYTHTHM
jgi:hypothetical protein